MFSVYCVLLEICLLCTPRNLENSPLVWHSPSCCYILSIKTLGSTICIPEYVMVCSCNGSIVGLYTFIKMITLVYFQSNMKSLEWCLHLRLVVFEHSIFLHPTGFFQLHVFRVNKTDLLIICSFLIYSISSLPHTLWPASQRGTRHLWKLTIWTIWWFVFCHSIIGSDVFSSKSEC